MVRKDWRKKVLARRAWRADVDATALDEINGALNDAVRKLAGDCPAAFVPDMERVVVLADVTQVDTGRGIATTADPYVMDLGVFNATKTNPNTTGVWDGVMHIEIQTADGVWHRYQCREFWSVVVVLTTTYYVSLDRPWTGPSPASGMNFRIHQPEFFFQDDVTEVLDGKVWDASGSRFMEVSERAVREWNEDDFQGRTKGRPEKMTKGRNFQLQGPAVAPVCSLPDQTVWIGREPIGTFRFCYTFVWGKKDIEIQDPFGQADPVWESSPSPVSAAVVPLAGAPTKVRIGALLNIDYMLNFDPPAGLLRNGHSGLRKRIYVFRDATDTTGAFVDEVEPRGVGHFLAEVDGNVASFDWDGSIVPNPFRRLPEVTGYFAHCLVPHQDKTYAIDFRVRRKPTELVNDYDAPRVQPQSEEALNLLAMYYIAQLDKQIPEADRYLELYLGNPRKGIVGELPKLLALWGNTARVLPGSRWGTTNGAGGTWQKRDGNYFKA